jgi:hypothetical protein
MLVKQRNARKSNLRKSLKPATALRMVYATQFDHTIHLLMHVLSPRSRSVIARRFGLFGAEPHTLDAIGQQEGLTRERIRQIEDAAVLAMHKSKEYQLAKPQFAALEKVLLRYGGVLSEKFMESAEVFGTVAAKQAGIFLLRMASFARHHHASLKFADRWYHSGTDNKAIEKALEGFARTVKATGRAYPEREFFSGMAKFIKPVGTISKPALLSYFKCARELVQNAYGEFGHHTSRLARPWGMRDEAFIAISKAGRPMHYTEVAGSILSTKGRTPRVSTVHNCLVCDDRFALVGRGTYALVEWGYRNGPKYNLVTSASGKKRRQRRSWKHLVHHN